jgi:hypothetical protein
VTGPTRSDSADRGDCDVLTDGDAEHKIVVLTVAPDTEDETKFRLAVVSGVYDPGHS